MQNSSVKLIIKRFLILQSVVIIYTFAGVFAKLAAGYELLSFNFLLFYGAEFLILGIYAIIWQQVIKRVELSLAYANRATAIIWSLLWAALFSGEQIRLNNIIGVIIIVIGTIIVNSDNA